MGATVRTDTQTIHTMTPYHYTLKVLRKLYGKVVGGFQHTVGPRECNINGYAMWFDAPRCKKDEMDKVPYKVCLIGCSAYGFPLSAHAKRQGKQAVHIGGALQLLFRIKGKRWGNPRFGIISLRSFRNKSILLNVVQRALGLSGPKRRAQGGK